MSVRTLAAVVFSILLAAPAVAIALPDPEDTVESLTAAGEPVTIKRDAYGVPHVYADDAYALFWGNGYAQAQDRLFQMDVLRHVGKGESARFLGPSQLTMDLATKRELYTDAERTATLNELSPEYRNMFQGFTDGVNAWIAKTRADPTLLSAEFYAIAHPPETWVPEDTIAIAQFLLDIFGAGSGGNELDNARVYTQLVSTLGEAEARKAFADMFWMQDPSTYTTISEADGTYTPTEGPMAWEDIPEWQWDLVEAAAGAHAFADGSLDSLQRTAAANGIPAKFGSNAYVVSPALSENGGALLFGGPQMAYHNPTIPYEVALHGAGFDAVGMGVGGAPGVIIGRTEHMAWTVTSGSSDQVDVVAVKLSGPREYFVSGTSGETKPMDCRIETHLGLPTAIDPNPPVLAVQEVCRTDAGPVFAINEEAGYAFSRLRTHRLDEVRSGALWLTISQAQNMDDFAAHMDTFRFEFNFQVADDGGNIGYYHFGANPDRSESCDPRFPRLAGLCDWGTIRTGDDLPHVKNPSRGYIANWNNKPALGWSSGDAIEKWGPENRVELIDGAIQDQLAIDGSLNIDDLKEINKWISTRSPYPKDEVPQLLAATADEPDEDVQAARAKLAEWAAGGYSWMPDDATCNIARAVDPCFGHEPIGFTIYEAWRGVAQDAFYGDELGALTRPMEFTPELSGDPHAADFGREDNKENVLVNALNGDTAHDWFAPQTADEFLASTFRTAVGDLIDTYQTVEIPSEPAKTMKFVGLSGGPAWRLPMVNRPTFHQWYDFGTGDAGSVLPPGTNQYWMPAAFIRFEADGTLSDAHKDDQLILYANFEWKPAQMGYAEWASEETFDTGSLVP
ncbi:MAG TPA: penicillin acylase family protein [Candidatus Thermoplasmatota archaeon]|nr:penicillin acylase family protein [Candidatus Thermoplasmatota archaeon]